MGEDDVCLVKRGHTFVHVDYYLYIKFVVDSMVNFRSFVRHWRLLCLTMHEQTFCISFNRMRAKGTTKKEHTEKKRRRSCIRSISVQCTTAVETKQWQKCRVLEER